ncbi:MAG: aminotransferase class III-fold pyridoxal phosphate-dependent enzyme [Candidatus Coatesbacteria bacterium]|nr:MAG: aminotransferase class III-fold pyridoxal phosphate-dependent enzyme [Candidatus Coatesbacteria bacterium]
MPREPQLRTEYPGPAARKLLAGAAKHVLGPGGTPVAVESASGARVVDVDGNVHLDFASGLYGNQTGHAHPTVVRAAIEKAQRLTVSYGFPYVDNDAVDLAERLRSAAPGRFLGPVSFACSGEPALAAAVESAMAATGRSRIAVFTDEPSCREEAAVRLPYPDCRRCPVGKNPGSCGVECLEKCIETLDGDEFRGEVAAAVFPLARVAGGFATPDMDFVAGFAEFAKKRKILLIADEIVTGFGRTGKLFASAYYKLTPDIIVCGGGLGTGMSLGAVTYKSRRTADAARPGAGTADPMSVAAAAAAVDLVERELAANARSMGGYLIDKLEGLLEESRVAGVVHGKGLLIGLEVVKDPGSGEPDGDRRDAIAGECRRRGLLVETAGPESIVFAPPLIVTKDQIDVAVRIIGDVLNTIKPFK